MAGFGNEPFLERSASPRSHNSGDAGRTAGSRISRSGRWRGRYARGLPAASRACRGAAPPAPRRRAGAGRRRAGRLRGDRDRIKPGKHRARRIEHERIAGDLPAASATINVAPLVARKRRKLRRERMSLIKTLRSRRAAHRERSSGRGEALPPADAFRFPHGARPFSLLDPRDHRLQPFQAVGFTRRLVPAQPVDAGKSHCQTGSRRHTCVPPMAVSAQGVHQPLQWNIGSVHR